METKILIVEDDGTSLVGLQRLLRKWGYVPLAADSGADALRLAAEEHPAFALMDIRLEDDNVDGITTAQELRTRFDIPVIYLTAYADEALLQRARQTDPYGYLVKPLQELTLRSTLEMAIAKRQADIRLKTALQEKEQLIREKEMLMQEILHRTKNNMAVIVNLLHLQSGRIEDDQMLSMFADIENRVQSMMLVQQKLYRSKNFRNLDLQDYVRDLAYTVFGHLQVGMSSPGLRFELESVVVSPDTAIHCGLLLNELLTNALKYAFPEGREGEISLSLHATDEGGIELGVRDNGIGLPEDVDFRKTESLGLELVALFAETQLRGTLELKRDRGTEWLIRFQERSQKK